MPAKLQGISIQADSVIMFAALFAVFAGSNDCPIMIVGNSIKRDYKQTSLGFSTKLLAFDYFFYATKFITTPATTGKTMSILQIFDWPGPGFYFLLSDKAATYQQYQQLNDQC